MNRTRPKRIAIAAPYLIAGALLALPGCQTTRDAESAVSDQLSGLYIGRPLSAFILWRNAEPVGAFDVDGARVFRFAYPCAAAVTTSKTGPGGSPAHYTIRSIRTTGPCLPP